MAISLVAARHSGDLCTYPKCVPVAEPRRRESVLLNVNSVAIRMRSCRNAWVWAANIPPAKSRSASPWTPAIAPRVSALALHSTSNMSASLSNPQNTMKAVFEWRGKNYVVSHSSVQLRIHTAEGIKVY
jgi:hypothetical protein